MIRQRVAIGAVVVGVLVTSACGSEAQRSSSFPETETDTETDTAPDTVADADTDTAPSVPPTTIAEPIPAFTCDDPIAIAENLLLERRQGAPASSCADPDPWLDSADDFVDFTLDPTGPSTGTVRITARYRTSDATSEVRAETMRFEQQPDDTWEMVGHDRIDLTDEVADAQSVATDYFDALADGDHLAAARLLAPTPASTDRPDLNRLEAGGLLGDRSVDGIADALAAWCAADATCDRPDDVRFEITPDHHVRIVATYEVGPTAFDVAFDTDGASIVGIPPAL